MIDIVYPQYVIIPTKFIICEFKRKISPYIKNEVDIKEIVIQLLQHLLNYRGSTSIDNTNILDFSMLIDRSFLNNKDAVEVISNEYIELYKSIKNILIDYGVIKQDKFDYCFDKFIDNDIVLLHLPY